MLYDVFYYDAKSGKRLDECDFDRHIPHGFKAGSGCVAHCVNTDWDKSDFWVDARGRVIPTPAWYQGRR